MRACLLLLLLSAACATPPSPTPTPPAPAPTAPTAAPAHEAPTPPRAARAPFRRVLGGETFSDDYFWLRNKGTRDVERHLEAEEAWAQSQLFTPLKPFTEQVYQELISHVAPTISSPPAKEGAWEYWSRVDEGKQYSTFLRRKVGPPAEPDEVLLDVNELGRGKAYIGLGDFDVSDDGNRLLYSTDETGFRVYTLHVKDLTTGALLPDVIEGVDGAAWAADGKTIFYVVEDQAKRPFRALRHVLGTDPAKDPIVYEERDERFMLSLGRTSGKKHLVLASQSKLTSEVRVIDAAKPTSAPVVIEPRVEGREYQVDDDGTQFLVLANDTGRNFHVALAPFARPGRANWKELVPHDDAVMLTDVRPFKGRLVLSVRRHGMPALDVLDLKTKQRDEVRLPEPVREVWLGANHELDAPFLAYTWQSPTTPTTWSRYDFATKTSTVVQSVPVPGGFDPKRYVTEQLEATATDGTKVPISLIAKADVPRDGTAPTLLEGYGSYGMSFPVGFDEGLLPLLDRGVVVAIAHVRGGGEFGKAWHEHGRLAEKMNTFTDFIACAEHLIATKRTHPKKLVISGGSAGGLLMGAVTNLRPDLFQAVVADVPFVDVINTMNDPSLPLTVGEYEEWGNPQKPEEYRWMRAYSPYDNLEKKAYPAMLVRSSYNDSQVMYFEPAKYVARLRALKTDDWPLYFHIRMEPAGHGGKSGRYEHYRERAEMEAFVLWQLGLGPVPAR